MGEASPRNIAFLYDRNVPVADPGPESSPPDEDDDDGQVEQESEEKTESQSALEHDGQPRGQAG